MAHKEFQYLALFILAQVMLWIENVLVQYFFSELDFILKVWNDELNKCFWMLHEMTFVLLEFTLTNHETIKQIVEEGFDVLLPLSLGYLVSDELRSLLLHLLYRENLIAEDLTERQQVAVIDSLVHIEVNWVLELYLMDGFGTCWDLPLVSFRRDKVSDLRSVVFQLLLGFVEFFLAFEAAVGVVLVDEQSALFVRLAFDVIHFVYYFIVEADQPLRALLLLGNSDLKQIELRQNLARFETVKLWKHQARVAHDLWLFGRLHRFQQLDLNCHVSGHEASVTIVHGVIQIDRQLVQLRGLLEILLAGLLERKLIDVVYLVFIEELSMDQFQSRLALDAQGAGIFLSEVWVLRNADVHSHLEAQLLLAFLIENQFQLVHSEWALEVDVEMVKVVDFVHLSQVLGDEQALAYVLLVEQEVGPVAAELSLFCLLPDLRDGHEVAI